MSGALSSLTPTSAGLAFLAGVVSLLSPCVLALVPAYLGYISSSAVASPGRARVLGRSAVFVLGFSAVFVALGASATALGRLLLVNQSLLRQVGGILVIVLGLHQLGVLHIGFLDVDRRLLSRLPGTARGGAPAHPEEKPLARIVSAISRGPWGAFFVGMAFAAGWSPCVGPVLAGILMMAGASQTVLAGMGLLALYAAGMALPFLVMAALVGGGARRLTGWFVHHGVWVERASGVLLVAIGVILYTNFFLRLPGYLNYYRWLGI